MSRTPAKELWTAPELLAFLRARGGNEFISVACSRVACVQAGKGKRIAVRELSAYRLTVRGDVIEATGPSGQTRQLSAEAYAEVFGHYLFKPAEATGYQTDLGPLFG